MRSLIANLRAFWRGLRVPSQVDADMNDEMRFHIEMEAARLQQRGMATGRWRRFDGGDESGDQDVRREGHPQAIGFLPQLAPRRESGG